VSRHARGGKIKELPQIGEIDMTIWNIILE
jgi:hypothetical protein